MHEYVGVSDESILKVEVDKYTSSKMRLADMLSLQAGSS